MKDVRLYLIQMRKAIEHIESYAAAGESAFKASVQAQDAIIRRFQVLGEAAKRVPADTRELAPEIPWRLVVSFRNGLVYEYDDIDFDSIWENIRDNLPPLRRDLDDLIKRLPE